MSQPAPRLILSRILHAGYTFTWGEDHIAFDPIFETPFSINCYAYPPVKFDIAQIKNLNFSAVFISHYHEDHCSLESLIFLNKEIPIYIFCLHEGLIQMIKDLGFQNVYALELDKTIQVGAFRITPRRALDEEVDSLFQIQVEKWQILNVVDSWIGPDTLELLSAQGVWDLILWPFQTMRELEVIAPTRFPASDRKIPSEWKEQLRILNPRAIVPSSCQFQMEEGSWYNKAFFPISYQIFENEIKEILPGTPCLRMNPGVSLELGSAGEYYKGKPLDWVIPLGDQNGDYHYDEKLTLPSQAQVAAYFPALADAGVERVIKFCTSEIIEKWNQLEITEDDYFKKQQTWKLILYPQQGTALEFFYNFHNAKISFTEAKNSTYSWLTEISMTKLYAALELGESLTSIYIRINAHKFSKEVELVLNEVDILIDPLLRCLYSGEVDSYQKAQFKRIKKNWHS